MEMQGTQEWKATPTIESSNSLFPTQSCQNEFLIFNLHFGRMGLELGWTRQNASQRRKKNEFEWGGDCMLELRNGTCGVDKRVLKQVAQKLCRAFGIIIYVP
eukprot:11900788-Ditylum_brightwellii.AAC.1